MREFHLRVKHRQTSTLNPARLNTRWWGRFRCISPHLRSRRSRYDHYYFRRWRRRGRTLKSRYYLPYVHATDGRYGELLTLPNADRVNPDNPIYLTMAGNEVFKVAVTELAHILSVRRWRYNTDRSELNWLVPHRRSWHLRIISATSEKTRHVDGQCHVVTLDKLL